MKNKLTIMNGIMAYTAMALIVLACKEDHQNTLIWTDTSSLPETSYQNPLFEPDLADPTFIRAADGWFYAYGTENTWNEGESHVVPIIKSKNLIKWTYVADAFEKKPTWHGNGGIWAPQIVFNDTDGFYYLYYSFSAWGDANPGIGVAKSKNPEGPFEDLGKIFDSNTSGVDNSIDPFYIQIGSGRNKKSYLFWGSFRGIYGVEMSDMKTAKMNTKFQIAGSAFEAAYIYVYDGKFYFFGSAGSCCEGADSQYRVTVAKADNIKGPYLSKSGAGILNAEGTPFLKGDRNGGWVGPGHNAEIIKDDDGRYFILYHAINVNNPFLPGGATRRPLMIDEIIWQDGWPTIEGGVPSHTIKDSPRFDEK